MRFQKIRYRQITYAKITHLMWCIKGTAAEFFAAPCTYFEEYLYIFDEFDRIIVSYVVAAVSTLIHRSQRNIWWPSESEIRLKDQWTILNQMCDQYGKVNLGTVDLNEIVIGSAVTSSLQMHSLYSFVEYFSFNPLRGGRGGEGVVQGSWMGNNLHCTRSIRQLSNLAALLKNSEKL